MDAAASAAAPVRRTLPLALSGALLTVVCTGLVLDAAGVGLGTELPPFFMSWSPAMGAWAALAAVALAAGALGAPHLTRLPALAFCLSASALALGLRLALAAARDGTSAWWSVFGSDPEAQNEYLPALPALDPGVGTFLDRFAEVAPSLPTHPSAHPPGMLLLLDGLGIEGARGMAGLVIATGVLIVPLTYLIARQLVDEEGARIAALLACFAPAALLYGATSADALFASLGAATAAALVSRGALPVALGAMLGALASFFSWALLAVPAWAVLVVALRDSRAAALRRAAACALALLAGYGLLHAASGYDPLGTLAAADEAYRLGISSARPYEFWVFGSPAAFLVMLGLPVAWLTFQALADRAAPAVALAIVIAVAALLGFTKAETERIWLFLVPFACVAAAQVLPRRALGPVLGALAGQALAIELLLETTW